MVIGLAFSVGYILFDVYLPTLLGLSPAFIKEDQQRQLRERMERGDADIYALATEFECSASQVTGIKAAMHR